MAGQLQHVFSLLQISPAEQLNFLSLIYTFLQSKSDQSAKNWDAKNVTEVAMEFHDFTKKMIWDSMTAMTCNRVESKLSLLFHVVASIAAENLIECGDSANVVFPDNYVLEIGDGYSRSLVRQIAIVSRNSDKIFTKSQQTTRQGEIYLLDVGVKEIGDNGPKLSFGASKQQASAPPVNQTVSI